MNQTYFRQFTSTANFQDGGRGGWDDTAVICALELNPTQLRIADQIAISPDEKRGRTIPEQVAIRNGQIVAEMWQK